MRIVLLAAPILLVSGCQKADNEPGLGDVTMGEARALDEAAQMIEDQRLPATAMAPVSEAHPNPTQKPPG